MMHRRTLLASAVAALLAAPLAGEAEPVEQRHRIGLLNAAAAGTPEAAFRESLRALGYVEGDNIVIDSRFAQGRTDRLPALANELLNARPEVIVTFGLAAAQAAKGVTTTTPIVMRRYGTGRVSIPEAPT